VRVLFCLPLLFSRASRLSFSVSPPCTRATRQPIEEGQGAVGVAFSAAGDNVARAHASVALHRLREVVRETVVAQAKKRAMEITIRITPES